MGSKTASQRAKRGWYVVYLMEEEGSDRIVDQHPVVGTVCRHTVAAVATAIAASPR